MRIKIAGLIGILSIAASWGMARAAGSQAEASWQAPASAQQVKNPVKVTKAGLAAAAKLYTQNCMMCHGKDGAGDGPAASFLSPRPANFTDERMMSKETDGGLFWKLSTGHDAMPGWKDQFSETDRWELVNYLRTFAKDPDAQKSADPRKR